MPPRTASTRRRSRDHDSEEDTDASLAPAEKRRRTTKPNGAAPHASTHDGDSQSPYQPGAITRVAVLNFVTYEDAEFIPGPNLNMVIGPNGTGKSSLVCAICIGLGYSANILGRAAKFGEFIKHGKDDASIEIELQRRPEHQENYVVKVRIIKDGDKRKWWLNGRETSLKNVQALIRDLGIQVDNLCQFLPQDRVVEFAALSPVELLRETQRAAADPEMVDWHEQLKKLHKERKSLQIHLDTDNEALAVHESRQEGLRADLERLQERQEIQRNITLLERSVPAVEYRSVRKTFVEKKQQAKVAGLRLKTLQRQVEPTLRAVNEKMDYRDLVDEVVVEREQELARAERAADAEARKFDASEENIKTAEQSIESEKQVDKSRRQELQSIQRQVTQLKAALRGEPPVFNAADFNSRIRAEELKLRALREEKIELEERERAVTEQGRQIRFQTSAKQKELQSLESREGANLVKLRRVSRDAAVAWEWIQNNRDQFEKEIFGPPIVECNIKDKNYIPAIESIFQRNHLLTFTVQSNNDFTRLNNQLYNVMRLGDITINTVQRGFAEQRRSPVSNERLRNLGLDGWAIDYVEGPDAVLAMLCISVRLDKTAVALRDIDEAQYDTIMNSDVTALVAGKSSYSIVRRREYGPGAVSTSHKTIKDPQLFTDAPVDTAVKNDIQRSLQELQSNFEALKSEIRPIKDRIAEIQSELVETDKKLKAIQLDKNEAQKHHVQFQSLPNRLGREEDKLKKKMRDGEDFETRMDDLKHQVEQLVLERNAIAIEHKQCVDTIRQLHAELLEAKLRQIEANSDVDALKAKNAGIVNQLDEEKHRFQRAEQEREIYKKRGSEAMQKIQEFIRQDPTYQEFFSSLDENLTLEELEQDIIAERSKLEFIRDSNPGALRQYEARKATIEQLQEKIAAAQEQIDHLDAQLTDIRGRWEPELDKVIEEISSAFAKNFEQIGCTGQVGVHKDEDFDNWSVEIRVKFRETESLQVLDAHRQSGGERAVSTIFYLMALQALARAPFRVVDEINQGMDPKNERMMHERMVEIACREHTSQYFLITPKLLAGLRYDPKMRILCIASGEHMPVDYRQLDIHKVIATKRALALTVR